MTRAAIVLFLLFLCSTIGLAACGSSTGNMPPEQGSGGAPASSGGASATTGGRSGSGGSTTISTGGAPVTGGGGATGGESLCGAVSLIANRTIAAGETVTVCAGTTITAASNVSLVVAGTLIVNGTASQPVRLQGTQAAARSWNGVVLMAGGTLNATYLEIHGAVLGIDARTGSAYAIDHLLIDNTTQNLNLDANGTIGHGTLHGMMANQAAPAITIDSASPHITDTVVDQGLYGGVDLVIINGATSAPVFDHIEIADSHCAIHMNVSAGLTLTNSYIHHNTYAFMMYSSTGNVFTHNNFTDNTINLGTCVPTTTAQVTGNFFQGAPPADTSCTSLEITGNAAAAYTDVGPRP